MLLTVYSAVLYGHWSAGLCLCASVRCCKVHQLCAEDGSKAAPGVVSWTPHLPTVSALLSMDCRPSRGGVRLQQKRWHASMRHEHLVKQTCCTALHSPVLATDAPYWKGRAAALLDCNSKMTGMPTHVLNMRRSKAKRQRASKQQAMQKVERPCQERTSHAARPPPRASAAERWKIRPQARCVVFTKQYAGKFGGQHEWGLLDRAHEASRQQ